MLSSCLECHGIRPAMIAERDRGEEFRATADLAEVDDRAVARDVPGRLQPLRSGEARAWRQADPVRQVGVGDTAAALQLRQDVDIDSVELWRVYHNLGPPLPGFTPLSILPDAPLRDPPSC